MSDIIRLQLNVDEESILMILLHKDGTVNRMGDGTESSDRKILLGVDEQKSMFSELEGAITPALEKYLVNQTLEAPNRIGKECMLEILIEEEGNTKGVRVKYGSESMGPPKEISDFLIKAIDVTELWYQNKLDPSKKKKKWWKW